MGGLQHAREMQCAVHVTAASHFFFKWKYPVTIL